MRLSRHIDRIQPSPTLALNQKAKEMMAAGKSVINLTVGEPDFPTPERILQAARDAMVRGETKYTPSSGIPELKDAILDVTKRDYGRTYRRSEVVVTAGAKQALFNLFLALLNDGDEVIVFAPYWVSYLDMIRFAGGEPVVVETQESDDFEPDVEAVARVITPMTRAIILNSPSNPTGAMYGKEVLERLAHLIMQHDQIVAVTDDIYGKIVFDGREFFSIGAIKDFPSEQLAIVNGVSKTYSMTGWRIGYALGPEPLIRAMDTLQSQSTSNATSISQWAALAALKGDQSDVSDMCQAFETRRNTTLKKLLKISGISCCNSKGSFYLFPNARSYTSTVPRKGRPTMDDVALAAYLLEECGVAVVPGSAFGAPGYLRISCAVSNELLNEGIERLTRGLSSLKSS